MGNAFTRPAKAATSSIASKEASIIETQVNSLPITKEPAPGDMKTNPQNHHLLRKLPEISEDTKDPHQLMIKASTAPLRAHLKRSNSPLSKREIKRQQKEATPSGEYTVRDNLTHITPYFHSYRTNAKGRWCGRPIIDVFRTEFKEKSLAYYEYAIDTGLLVVNGEKIPQDYVLRMGDLINHMIHRHEPPISGTPIRIVDASVDGLVAIHKPAGYNYQKTLMIKSPSASDRSVLLQLYGRNPGSKLLIDIY